MLGLRKLILPNNLVLEGQMFPFVARLSLFIFIVTVSSVESSWHDPQINQTIG